MSHEVDHGISAKAAAAHPTDRILSAVRSERRRQDEKWGEQNHPDHAVVEPIDGADVSMAYNIIHAEGAKWLCEQRAKSGTLSWSDILIEEVAEAIEATTKTPLELREELIQVAAVATAWVEAIDRRAK